MFSSLRGSHWADSLVGGSRGRGGVRSLAEVSLTGDGSTRSRFCPRRVPPSVPLPSSGREGREPGRLCGGDGAGAEGSGLSPPWSPEVAPVPFSAPSLRLPLHRGSGALSFERTPRPVDPTRGAWGHRAARGRSLGWGFSYWVETSRSTFCNAHVPSVSQSSLGQLTARACV